MTDHPPSTDEAVVAPNGESGLSWAPLLLSRRPTDAMMTIVVAKPLMDPSGLDGQISRRLFDANDPEWTGIVRFWSDRWTVITLWHNRRPVMTGPAQTYGPVIRFVGFAPARRG
jgi:hypothetical protein